MNAEPTEVTVRAIAAGGDGVATMADGRTVFIPRAAPADRLRLRNVRLHKRFARAEIDAIVEPGPDRVAPPCPHYLLDRCGSCQLMHLSAEGQRAIKARIIGDALRRIGHFDLDDPEVLPAPTQLGYRTKVTFALSAGRFGYHPVGDANRVFDVGDCLLAEPALQKFFRAVSSARATLPRDRARVVLRLDRERRLHLVVRTEEGAVAWGGAVALDAALRKLGFEAVIWWHPDGGRPRAMTGSEDPWPATVFEQVHPALGATVRSAAVTALGSIAGRHAWDLYAGIGQTTAELVAAGATVESVESDGTAVSLAESLGPKGPRRHAGLVEQVASRLHPPAVVVTNPPRTGMSAEVLPILAQSGAARIAYISCDPATLARDLVGLSGRYQLRQVTGYDQFPQTSHVETLAVLEQR